VGKSVIGLMPERPAMRFRHAVAHQPDGADEAKASDDHSARRSAGRLIAGIGAWRRQTIRRRDRGLLGDQSAHGLHQPPTVECHRDDPLIQIAIILALSRAMRRLFVSVQSPAVIGEMVAGLMLGPSCFGWLMPRAFAALFPPATLPSLNALSQIGLVLFMFIVGLRLRSHSLGTKRGAAIVTSLASIVVPFALGALLASAVHQRLAPPGVGPLLFALFIGAAMSITAFPVLARILIDHRLLTSELGVPAITCAALTT
jgi:hypothetical protein